MDIATLRTLRLGFGSAISLLFAELVAWDLSFIAPTFTLFILALPVPAPRLMSGLRFMIVVPGIMYLALLMLPTLIRQPLAGLVLLVVVLFWSFYYVARGGDAVLGTFVTVGIAIVTALGSVSIDATLAVLHALTIGIAVGVAFVWVAHALLPDSMAVMPAMPVGARPAPPAPDLAVARWNALRSMWITLPVVLWLLFSSASAAYVPALIKVASMGQQASGEGTRAAGRSLIQSTLIGGGLAILGYYLIALVPSLTLYAIFIALTGFFCGRRIFAGPAMTPNAGTWSYGYMTFFILLLPSLMDGSPSAGEKFWDRILMFLVATLYSVAAVYVYDAFWKRPAPTPVAREV